MARLSGGTAPRSGRDDDRVGAAAQGVRLSLIICSLLPRVVYCTLGARFWRSVRRNHHPFTSAARTRIDTSSKTAPWSLPSRVRGMQQLHQQQELIRHTVAAASPRTTTRPKAPLRSSSRIALFTRQYCISIFISSRLVRVSQPKGWNRTTLTFWHSVTTQLPSHLGIDHAPLLGSVGAASPTHSAFAVGPATDARGLRHRAEQERAREGNLARRCGGRVAADRAGVREVVEAISVWQKEISRSFSLRASSACA